MSRASSPAFAVQIGAHGPEALSVSGVSGIEGVSRLYDFRVDFFARDGEPLAVTDLVGQDALVTLSVRDGAIACRTVTVLVHMTGRRLARAPACLGTQTAPNQLTRQFSEASGHGIRIQSRQAAFGRQ